MEFLDENHVERGDTASSPSESVVFVRNYERKRESSSSQLLRRRLKGPISINIGKDKVLLIDRRIEYQGDSLEFANIDGIRYGAILNSINAVPTGTDYLVAVTGLTNNNRITIVLDFHGVALFGRAKREAYVRLTTFLLEFVQKPMVMHMLEDLWGGSECKVSGVDFRTDGIKVVKSGNCLLWTEYGGYDCSNGQCTIYSRERNVLRMRKKLISLSLMDQWNAVNVPYFLDALLASD
jgi:hypothetical protein